MKIFFLFLATWFVFSACVAPEYVKNQQENLFGFWKVNRISGGITGSGYPADFTTLQFHNNGTYTIYNHDALIGDGIFQLVNENNKWMLKISPNDAMNLVFESLDKEIIFERDKLLIRDACCDFYEYEFVKDKKCS